jgi:HAD superfamily hydrolase (TIGR01509 family)
VVSPPKAVIFDLGKVLLDFDYGITVARILERCRVSAEELRELIDQSPLHHRYEKGLISTDQFFREVQVKTGYEGSKEEFVAAFADIFTAIPAMVELHARLCERRIPTSIFSNTNELAIRHVTRQFPFFNEFNGYVYSYESHSMKPDTRLYEAVERCVGFGGDALLYLDDRLENVTAGEAHGWRARLHESPEQSIEIVREAGLLE